jgi:recombination protein RecA
MSSVAVFSPAELPSFSDADTLAAKRAHAVGALSSSVRPASALEVRPTPDMVPFGIESLDAMTEGVPRGALTELFGPASSGRTSVMMSLIASVTRRQEVCAVIDVTDSFDPASAEAAGVDLQRLLWVRCGKTVSSCEFQVSGAPQRNAERRPAKMNEVAPPAKNISWSIHENYDARLRHAITGGCFEMARGRVASSQYPVASKKAAPPPTRNPKPETRYLNSEARNNPASKWTKLDQALKATDLLLQSGGFGLIVIDLGDISVEQARRIPLTSWFRFRRVVENTPTILLLVARDTCAKTCASLVLQLQASGQWTVNSGQNESGVRSRESGFRPLSTDHCSPSHANLLDGLDVRVELVRTRLQRKPVRSVSSLATETLWRRIG